MSKRLFIGFGFDDESSEKILKIQRKLRKEGLEGNFTDNDNIHLTLYFIGNSDEDDEYLRLLEEIDYYPIRLKLDAIRHFSKKNRNIIYLGTSRPIVENKPFVELLESMNLSSKNFVIHVTLLRNSREYMDFDLEKPIEVLLRRPRLYESRQVDGRLRYIPQIKARD